MTKCKISIITPLYQGKRYIPRLADIIALCERAARTVSTVEWVISNDDPNEDITNEIDAGGASVKILNTDKNRGIQGARVRGLEASDGEYILFLDQDDVIYDKWIVSQIEHIGNADAVVCDCTYSHKAVYETGYRPSLMECISKEYNLSVKHGFIPGQVMIRREAIPMLWRERWLSHNCCDDYYLWLAMYATGKKFMWNPNTLYDHTLTGENQTYDTYEWVASTYEMMAILKEADIFTNDDYRMLKEARETEIRNILDDSKWLRVRQAIYKRLLGCYEKDTLNLDSIEGKEGIAIYGADLGIHLYYLLKRAGVSVACMIDRAAEVLSLEIPAYTREGTPGDVRIVINTLLKPENKEGVKMYMEKEHPAVKVIDLTELF